VTEIVDEPRQPGMIDPDWDAFVESSPNGAYTQLSAWAAIKRANGWLAHRIRAGANGTLGAQVLVRRIGRSLWSVGYAPRGPIPAARYSEPGVAALTGRLRELAREERLSHVIIDPEVEAGDVLADWLDGAGWRPAPPIQPDRSRLVDLSRPEEALWSDLRSKWRQYVQKARRNGVTVVESGAEGLEDFYRIYVDTARRAGFLYRTADSYRRTFETFAADGRARLLFAALDGAPVATLVLVHCGRRVIEPYGGMLPAGADARANYLLKWEAIRSSRERGFAIYDMWGLSHAGIEQFKTGFGGREVRYIGAWELVANPPVRLAVGAAQRLRVALARRRHGLDGRGAAAPADAG
jgi:lipid II:glycine glycyltransferase (peptidoglycan interpeptide bridge formation enzyme)